MNRLFKDPFDDESSCLQDGEYSGMLEQIRSLLSDDRDSVLTHCRDLAMRCDQAEKEKDFHNALRTSVSEEQRLLKLTEGELSCLHWDRSSLFRQALSQEDKRTVCRMLTHLEDVESLLRQMMVWLDRTEHSLLAFLREADKELVFLNAVSHCAVDDLEISSLCNGARLRWENYRTACRFELERVNEGRDRLAPMLRQQLPYVCTQLLKHADLDGEQSSGNVREILSLMSSFLTSFSSALSEWYAFFFSS